MPLGKAAQRFGALLLLEASLAAQIGVAPEDQENYACHGDPCTFRCLSGQKDTLPLSAINDDFCDCEDGSDEPGTAACAGRGQETLFYCPNAEGIPRLIYTSRVRDGICDCCDGSDELAGDTTPCSNTCSDEGAERERTLERFRRGLEKHKEGRRDAKNSRQRWREEVESLKQQHAKLLKEDGQQTLRQGAMADLQRMKDEIEALKEQIRVLQARQDGMENQVTSSASGREASEESAAVAASAADVPKTQVDDVAKAPEEALPQVSEYAKWMDNSEAMLETTPSTSQAIEETEVKQAGSEPSTNQTDMKQKLDKTKSRIKELEDKLGFLPEDKLAYFPLLDTCLESDKFNGHTYSICFFRSAHQSGGTQGNVSLGSFAGWKGQRQIEFKGGKSCGSAQRQLTVKFRCSEEVKIVEVSEPGHCSYEAVVQSAGACGKKIRCSKDKWPRFKTNPIARMLIGGVRCPRKKKRWCCGCGSQDRNSKMGCPIGEAWVPTPAVCPSETPIV